MRWRVSLPSVGLMALALFIVLNVAGCSCNAPNSFDERYCEAYSGDTPLPAFAIPRRVEDRTGDARAFPVGASDLAAS